jgi:hypothetical protein
LISRSFYILLSFRPIKIDIPKRTFSLSWQTYIFCKLTSTLLPLNYAFFKLVPIGFMCFSIHTNFYITKTFLVFNINGWFLSKNI